MPTASEIQAFDEVHELQDALRVGDVKFFKHGVQDKMLMLEELYKGSSTQLAQLVERITGPQLDESFV